MVSKFEVLPQKWSKLDSRRKKDEWRGFMAEAVGVNDMRQATPKGLVSEKEYLPTKLVDNCVCRKGPVGLASSAMKS